MLIEIIILALLGTTSVRQFGWSSISAIYNFIWAFSLILISFGGSGLYPLDARFVACLLLIGVLSLAFDILTARIGFKPLTERRISYVHFKVLTVLFILLFPIFIRYITSLSDVGVDGNLLFRIRYATLQSGGGLGIMSVVVLLSTFHAVACLQHRKYLGRYWVSAALALALAMQVLSAARTGLIALICAALIMYWLDRRSVGLRAGFAAVILVLSSFILTSWFRTSSSQISGVSGKGLLSQLPSLIEGLSLYFGSGPVAFSQIIDSSSTIISENYIWNNFLNTLGIQAESLSGILPYSYIPIPTNIYSMFLPYYSYGGWVFVVVSMSILLASLSLLFKLSKRGYKIPALFYSFGAAFMVQSPIGDGFLVGFPVWLQLTLYVFLMYILIPSILKSIGGRSAIDSYS